MKTEKELTANERKEGLRKLAERLGCPSPSWISDAFSTLVLGIPSLDPILLDKWLVRTNKYHPEMCDESIEECMVRVYGREWADLAKKLI